jgi:RNA polymerase sigma factor (sigma-70 family)
MIRSEIKTASASDKTVIEKILEGESALFEVLIRRYNGLLYKLARSYGLSHHDAEDVMQETHFNAYLNLGKFRMQSSYKTWLTQIHLHACYHKIQKRDRKFELVEEEGNENLTVMELSISNHVTEKTVLNNELSRLLEVSLLRIPAMYREVFILREVEGFSIAETSELLNITPVNVKVRVNRAKALLQKQLESFYSSTEIFSFHLSHCDNIVAQVFQKIAAIS